MADNLRFAILFFSLRLKPSAAPMPRIGSGPGTETGVAWTQLKALPVSGIIGEALVARLLTAIEEELKSK